MMAEPELSERERVVLQAVVHTYITTAEPVGSRSVVKRFGLDWSPATVRNVMSDLEDLGYVQQLHTSSGRVPTDKGYRYYVDYLMRVQELTLAEQEQIEREFSEKLSDADEVLRHTSHLLALITAQAGMAEAPSDDAAEVRQIEIMAVGEQQIAVLIVDHFGRVRSMSIRLEHPPSAAELPVLNRFLNEHLRGVTIEHLVGVVERKCRAFLDEQRLLAEQALRVLNLVPQQRHGQLFLEGATQLFEQPEFKDIARAREVFGLLEEHDRLIGLLRATSLRNEPLGGFVLIGSENEDNGVEGISVVASPYRVGGQQVGMIGVLGPRRMPYSRLTAIVDYTAGMVGRILTRLGG